MPGWMRQFPQIQVDLVHSAVHPAGLGVQCFSDHLQVLRAPRAGPYCFERLFMDIPIVEALVAKIRAAAPDVPAGVNVAPERQRQTALVSALRAMHLLHGLLAEDDAESVIVEPGEFVLEAAERGVVHIAVGLRSAL